MTFHMPDSYYDPPDPHECDKGDDCTCEQDAADAYDDAMAERADARRDEVDW